MYYDAFCALRACLRVTHQCISRLCANPHFFFCRTTIACSRTTTHLRSKWLTMRGQLSSTCAYWVSRIGRLTSHHLTKMHLKLHTVSPNLSLFTSLLITSPCVTLPHLTSHYLTVLTSHYLTPPCLRLNTFTVPHLTSPYSSPHFTSSPPLSSSHLTLPQFTYYTSRHLS